VFVNELFGDFATVMVYSWIFVTQITK